MTLWHLQGRWADYLNLLLTPSGHWILILAKRLPADPLVSPLYACSSQTICSFFKMGWRIVWPEFLLVTGPGPGLATSGERSPPSHPISPDGVCAPRDFSVADHCSKFMAAMNKVSFCTLPGLFVPLWNIRCKWWNQYFGVLGLNPFRAGPTSSAVFFSFELDSYPWAVYRGIC